MQIITVYLSLTTVLRHVPLSTSQKMFPSLEDTHNSKLSTNFEHDSSQLLSSHNLIEPLRHLWKMMLAIKQLLISCLNTTSSTDASSFIQLSSMRKPSPLQNATGQSMIKNCSQLWTCTIASLLQTPSMIPLSSHPHLM